jgi:hypothetical protein
MERCPVIKLNQIIADTIWIYSIYRIFESRVKRQGLKILICAFKKGANPWLGFTPLICDYNRTSVIFGVHDIYLVFYP